MDNIRIETNVRHVNGVPVLDVSGEIDIYTTPQFKESVTGAIDEGASTIVINMAGVEYMDSSGFGTLLSATKRLRPMHGSLRLYGCNDAITRMLQITRLNTIFGVYESEQDALADFGDAPASEPAANAAAVA
ncbi:MAG: STAS domain-containing protein [Capsulimonadaceae bacterium]